MKPDDIYAIVYFGVFFALVVGSWLFWRRLDSKQKKFWHSRLSILSLVILGPFILFPVVTWGDWMFLAMGIAVIALIGFITIVKVRVCDVCGTVTQPDTFFGAAKFCRSCGTKLSAFELFGSAKQ